jgi:hypothetical protein
MSGPRLQSRASGSLARVAIRLETSDEYMHELGPESNFNESMYINIFDPADEVGGFFRTGNRGNEGYAEMTVCFYLPDGRVGFMFKQDCRSLTRRRSGSAGSSARRRTGFA